MTLTTSINGKANQVFLNQQNALRLHAERAGGVLIVHKGAKVVVRNIESSFCTEDLPVRVSSDNSSEGIRYKDPIYPKVFYRSFFNNELQPLVPERT